MADPNATFAPDTFSFHSEQFQTYATTPDLVSTMVTISTIENATFSLISQPRGPISMLLALEISSGATTPILNLELRNVMSQGTLLIKARQ